MKAHGYLAVCTDVCGSHVLLSFSALRLGLSHSNVKLFRETAVLSRCSNLPFQVFFASAHSIHFKDKKSRINGNATWPFYPWDLLRTAVSE